MLAGRLLAGHDAKPRDEEAARRVDVRKRLEELGARDVTERRPLPREARVDLRRAVRHHGVDDVLRLLGVDGARRVDDGAAWPGPRDRRVQQLALELRQWLRAPAEVGS